MARHDMMLSETDLTWEDLSWGWSDIWSMDDDDVPTDVVIKSGGNKRRKGRPLDPFNDTGGTTTISTKSAELKRLVRILCVVMDEEFIEEKSVGVNSVHVSDVLLSVNEASKRIKITL